MTQKSTPASAPVPDGTNPPAVVLPPFPPPPYRPPVANPPANQNVKKKKYIRIAAGVTWVDPTLSDWDPSE